MNSDAVLALVVITALAFDFTNGFHDTGNAMATSIATGALPPKIAVALSGVLNLVGAFLSFSVAATIASGLVQTGKVTLIVVFGGLAGGIAWNLFTWLAGIPSSSSHALIGGVVGSTIAAAGGISAAVVAARAHDVPWKATAGLHHPVRGMHDGTVMHGFLNLFIAGIALQAEALDAARIGEVLAEEDPRAFVIDPTHIGWQDVRVEAEAVAAARERCVSFGSCSFDEPVDDLRELGILL